MEENETVEEQLRKEAMLDKNPTILKVVRLGLQDKIFNMMKENKNAEEMVKILKSEGINIHPHSIRKFINTNKDAAKIFIAKDIKKYGEYKKLVMEYDKEIKTILDDVNEMRQLAKDTKDFQAYSALVGRLLQGIDLFAKIMGDIKPDGSTEINFIFNEISKDVEKELKTARGNIFTDEEIIDVDFIVNDEVRKATDDINAK